MFRILGRKPGKGPHGVVYYRTTEGVMTGKQVSERIGISHSAFNSRVRAYGAKDERVVKGARLLPVEDTKPGSWEGLSSRERPENLKKLEKMTMSDFLKD